MACASLLAFVLLALATVAGSSNGGGIGEGFRSAGLPRGFEEVNFEHFRKSLATLWQRLTSRDPAELAAKLAIELGSQQLASRWRTWRDDTCLPPSLRPMVRKIETASALIQLAYDPSRGGNIMGVGPLQGYKIVRSNWDAQIFQPAFVILQSTAKPKSFWIVVRGTYSVEDILTDISAEPERFMDGHVHKGILRSAEFLVAEIKACLKERLPRTGKGKKAEGADLLLVGHSLGAGAAAIATAMLRIEQLQAKAIVFGAPSCVHRTTYLENMLLRHVTHLVLEHDIIPRLNNETITKLVQPASSTVHQLFDTASKLLLNRLRDAVSDNRPLAKVLGVSTRPSMQCPPGRTYLLQAHPENFKAKEGQHRWGIAEVECHELDSIILSPNMLKDHNVASYVNAAQDAMLRYLPDCDGPSSEL